MSTTSIRDREPTVTATDPTVPVGTTGRALPGGRRTATALALTAVALVGGGLWAQLAAGTSDPAADLPQPAAPVEQQRWGGVDVYEPGGRTAPQQGTGRWGGPDVHEPRPPAQG